MNDNSEHKLVYIQQGDGDKMLTTLDDNGVDEMERRGYTVTEFETTKEGNE